VPYAIEYLPDAIEHLEALDANQRAVLFDGVREQLTHQPTVRTRNRKRMRPNPLAPWELRVGPLRAFFDVQDEPPPTVLIVAVGIKEGNRVRIGGKEVLL
jgi:mRNA-degrading endonuclease RelE of RelBE toxin-antitoxin system